MTRGRRINNILSGILMLAAAAVMMLAPDFGFKLIALILSVTLLFTGVRGLWYYFTMARYMVGGRIMLYRGVILFDLGVFTWALSDFPKSYIIIYLVAYHAFAGIVDILYARQSKQQGASWKLRTSHGAVNIMVAISCLAFAGFPDVLVYVYSAGLAYSALVQIATAFRRSAIVYIQ